MGALYQKLVRLSSRLVLVVSHGCDIAIPTRAAIAAFVRLRRCETSERTTRTRILHRSIIGSDFGRMLEITRRRRVEHCSGNANGEIWRKLTEHLAVLANNRVLSRGQPVRDIRSHFAHLHDVDEMRKRLQIARIVPAKVRNLATLLSDDIRHRCDPARIEQTFVAAFHRFDHIREIVHSLASIALLASATLHLAELASDIATASGNADTPAWHLAGLGESADDILGVGSIKLRSGIVDRNGANRSLGESESSHSAYATTNRCACQAYTLRIVDNFGISLCTSMGAYSCITRGNRGYLYP